MNINDDPEGFHSPYAEFLERRIKELEKILQRLILAHGEQKPIEAILEEIEEWLGDDWWVDLSDKDQKRLDAIKGWTYSE